MKINNKFYDQQKNSLVSIKKPSYLPNPKIKQKLKLRLIQNQIQSKVQINEKNEKSLEYLLAYFSAKKFEIIDKTQIKPKTIYKSVTQESQRIFLCKKSDSDFIKNLQDNQLKNENISKQIVQMKQSQIQTDYSNILNDMSENQFIIRIKNMIFEQPKSVTSKSKIQSYESYSARNQLSRTKSQIYDHFDQIKEIREKEKLLREKETKEKENREIEIKNEIQNRINENFQKIQNIFLKDINIQVKTLEILSEKDQKIVQFLDQLQKINISNNHYVQQSPQIKNYKIFIAKGNNSNVIEQAFKKRWWWKIIDDQSQQCNLVWSQLKIQQLLDKQPEKQQIQYTQQNCIQNIEKDVNLLKIFNEIDYSNFHQQFKNKIINIQEIQKIKNINQKCITSNRFVHNHIDKNCFISNKKLLFYSLKSYCQSINDDPFNYIPITFHIQHGIKDEEFQKFKNHYFQKQNGKKSKNIYIIKPGENTNRGFGIQVEQDFELIQNIIDQKEIHSNGMPKTYIIQSYIDRPLLFNKRKFDIRCFLLITSQNGIQKGYWFEEGYLRTSSTQFTLKNLQNKMIHLTNDAIQKKSEEYGKFEGGNKISYKEFEKYLFTTTNAQFKDILQQMKNIATLTLKSVYGKMNPLKKDDTFEV